MYTLSSHRQIVPVWTPADLGVSLDVGCTHTYWPEEQSDFIDPVIALDVHYNSYATFLIIGQDWTIPVRSYSNHMQQHGKHGQ